MSDDPRELTVVPEGEEKAEAPRDAVLQPGKLLRIATMTRELLDEVRQASIDDRGRDRLQQIYESSVRELNEVLSEDLQEELSELAVPFQGTPSAAEIRLAQAQLLGWLEGLFHGIQAALWAQQMQARTALEEVRRRGLPHGPPGHAGPPGQSPTAPGEPTAPPGQYL